MVISIIRWSVKNRILVLIASAVVLLAGLYSVKNIAVDAIPDLSDVQVIIKTSYPGQAPQVVEDQVTYPLTTAMLAVPKAVNVRGYSFYGDSYVYVIFEDGTDLYWARARVLEYLSQISTKLPTAAKPTLGPDATGVGWIYSYALVDPTGRLDLTELRSLQDWFLKFELQTVPGVAEVATVGGMVKQYQVVVDPNQLRAYNIPLKHIEAAIKQANQETGASVIELGEAEYMVRSSGYLNSLEDIKNIPLGIHHAGTPLMLGDIASIRTGPQMRRGIAELNGEGEVVGGIIVMRHGENAQATINGVKEKLALLMPGLPDGVEIITTYDRSRLIQNAITNLLQKISEEFIAVAVICALFLFHIRSSLVITLCLPVAIFAAYIVMYWQGINANIMSLGGIAIAIGAMVDGTIVMVENFHRHKEKKPALPHWQQVTLAAEEVGPPLFFSLLIITVSFLPIFALEAQEGKLFSPLAYTKTYAMAAAALISITLVPVLIGYFIRGKLPKPGLLDKSFTKAYAFLLKKVLAAPKITLLAIFILTLVGASAFNRIGSEFMPPLDEGDLLYMPTTFTGISIGKARQILQQTDRLIKTHPEVITVFGKLGRAETATDPAPITMIETIIQLKPKSAWRAGITRADIRRELDALIKFPGLSNAWVMPIKTRIDMLATGIKTPVGLKISGPDLKIINTLGMQLEKILLPLKGTISVYAERVSGGRYITIDIHRLNAARYQMNIADIQQIIRTAIGGMNIAETLEGRERYPINLRYPQAYRNSIERLRMLPIITPSKQQIVLADIASIQFEDGPAAIKSENARLNGWVYIDIADQDISAYILHARQSIAEQLSLPAGYSLKWVGQYEYMERAKAKMKIVVPITLLLILLFLYLHFRRLSEAIIIMLCLPTALVGGIAIMLFLEHKFSVASAVGFIALAGVAAEIGVLMMSYLNHAYNDMVKNAKGLHLAREDILHGVIHGASLRLRPILMTSVASLAGLMPIMLGDGTGSEIMQRIAAPMIGGIITTLLLALIALPCAFWLWKSTAHKL